MKKTGPMLAGRVFNSAIKSPNVKMKEMVLGYLLGPLFALLLNATLTAYLNLFYTDVLGLANKQFGSFLAVFPIASTVLVVAANMLMGTIIDKTRTKQGKARPYLLLAAPLLAVSCIMIFAVPSLSPTATMVWVVVSYNLYYSLAYAVYSMSHSLMVPLSTRNIKQRGQLSVVSNVANMGAAGLFASIVFPMLFLPWVGVDQGRWVTVMGVLGAISLVAVLLEYYFTRERITEESQRLAIKEEKIPLKKQLRAITTDRYWWLIIGFYLLYQAGSCFKNNALVYFCNYILGTYNDGFTQTVLAALSGIPMAVGALVAWPLASRFGKRNVTIVGFIISVLGGMLCWMAPTSFPLVLVGQTLKGFGGIPGVYIMMALFADVLDHLEAKNGFRCDGLSMSLYSAIMVAMTGVCMGLFNLMLSSAGYAAPTEINGVTQAVAQSAGVVTVIKWSFLGIEIVGHAVLAFLMLFLTVEKNIDAEQKQIVARQKAQVLAAGGEWIPPEERDRREQQQADEQAELDRLRELRERCDKRGLSFEEEEARYQQKLAAKKK